VVAAFVVILLPLPNPAAGGTCGPSLHGSEPAIAAFFDPVSIGAGPIPSGATALYQWQAFVGQCQASTNARMVDALALLLLAGLFFFVVLPFVRRAWHEPAAATAPHSAVAGWYPDPADPGAWRWWDGHFWAGEPTPVRQDPDAAYGWTGQESSPAPQWPSGQQAAVEEVPAEHAAVGQTAAEHVPAEREPSPEDEAPETQETADQVAAPSDETPVTEEPIDQGAASASDETPATEEPASGHGVAGSGEAAGDERTPDAGVQPPAASD